MTQLSLYGEVTPLYPFPQKIYGRAEFSIDLRYRYRLDRWWAPERGTLIWVLLNPSIAGAEETDRTIEQVIHFTWRENFGRLVVVNLFALVSTSPALLTTDTEPEPVGPLADRFIQEAMDENGRVIVAWGAAPVGPTASARTRGRDKAVLDLLGGRELYCLGITKAGAPRHPCRLAKATEMVRWPRAA
jgi:hypothetical protein